MDPSHEPIGRLMTALVIPGAEAVKKQDENVNSPNHRATAASILM
jgi:hypothetical protein